MKYKYSLIIYLFIIIYLEHVHSLNFSLFVLAGTIVLLGDRNCLLWRLRGGQWANCVFWFCT